MTTSWGGIDVSGHIGTDSTASSAYQPDGVAIVNTSPQAAPLRIVNV